MKRQQAITAILASLPALILAVCAWLNAQAKAAEAKQAYAGYGEYVTDQLHRDEALLKALDDCLDWKRQQALDRLANMYQAQDVTGEGAIAGMVKPETRQAQVVLDDVARSRGWEPGGIK